MGTYSFNLKLYPTKVKFYRYLQVQDKQQVRRLIGTWSWFVLCNYCIRPIWYLNVCIKKLHKNGIHRNTHINKLHEITPIAIAYALSPITLFRCGRPGDVFPADWMKPLRTGLRRRTSDTRTHTYQWLRWLMVRCINLPEFFPSSNHRIQYSGWLFHSLCLVAFFWTILGTTFPRHLKYLRYSLCKQTSLAKSQDIKQWVSVQSLDTRKPRVNSCNVQAKQVKLNKHKYRVKQESLNYRVQQEMQYKSSKIINHFHRMYEKIEIEQIE